MTATGISAQNPAAPWSKRGVALAVVVAIAVAAGAIVYFKRAPHSEWRAAESGWAVVGSGQTEGLSGMAALPDSNAARRFLIVQNNKQPQQGRVSLISVKASGTPSMTALDWPETQLPVDLEALTIVPGPPGRFATLTSKGKGYLFDFDETKSAIKNLQTFQVDNAGTEHEFEGFDLLNLGGHVWAVWADPGDVRKAATLAWAPFDVSSAKLAGAVQTTDLRVPWPIEHVRHVSDLKTDPAGLLYVTSTAEFGNDGPFESAVYIAGYFRAIGDGLQFTSSPALTPIYSTRQHKIEALALLSGANGGLALGSDDENLGGSILISSPAGLSSERTEIASRDSARVLPRSRIWQTLWSLLLIVGTVIVLLHILKEATVWHQDLERRFRDVIEVRQRQDAIVIGAIFLVAIVAGSLTIAIAAIFSSANSPQAACTGIVAAMASLLVGFAVGFLFSFPRVKEEDDEPPPVAGQATTEKAARARAARHYQVNSNLAQVSDWLTKVLIGVGLTQINSFLGYFQKAYELVGNALGGEDAGRALAASLIVFYLLVGFLGGYLLTRTFLSGAFARADSLTNLCRDDSPGFATLKSNALGSWSGGTHLPPEAQEAAEEIAKFAPESMRTWQELGLWAKAKLAIHTEDELYDPSNKTVTRIGEAVLDAFKRAFRLAPGEASLRMDYSTALFLMGNVKEAIRQLEAAQRLWQPQDGSDLYKSIHKSLTFLPLSAENGFEKVIEYGQEYVRDPRHVPSGVIWGNLACAYGQLAAQIQGDTSQALTGQAELQFKVARDKVEEAVREAVKLAPALREKLRSFLDKGCRLKTDESTGDAAAFFANDERIRALLDLPAVVSGSVQSGP